MGMNDIDYEYALGLIAFVFCVLLIVAGIVKGVGEILS